MKRGGVWGRDSGIWEQIGCNRVEKWRYYPVGLFMRIENIRRWQWMVIAVLVGAVIGGARQMFPPDPIAEYGGNTVNGQLQFESSLLINARTQLRHFKELVVSPPLEIAGKKKYIVSGKFYNGRPTRLANGQSMANFIPYCYIHEEATYTPLLDLSRYNKPGGVDYVKKWKEIKNPTVVDFLTIMKEVEGIPFKHAWYNEAKTAMGIWIGGCFVVIGVIWPCIVYLIAFGSIFEPPREKSIDLSALRGVNTSTAAANKPQVSQAEIDRVKQMGDELEAKLKSGAGERAAAGPAAPATEQPVRQLSAGPAETTAVEEQKDDKLFGANADDFYPTERKVKHENKPG